MARRSCLWHDWHRSQVGAKHPDEPSSMWQELIRDASPQQAQTAMHSLRHVGQRLWHDWHVFVYTIETDYQVQTEVVESFDEKTFEPQTEQVS